MVAQHTRPRRAGAVRSGRNALPGTVHGASPYAMLARAQSRFFLMPSTSSPPHSSMQGREPTRAAGRREHRLLWLAAALGGVPFLGLLLLHARPLWVFTADDTFITLRYARHLAEGLGPAWNPGGPRAEGCTTTLWMLLMAVPHLFTSDALLWAKLGSMLCALGCGTGAAWLALAITRDLSVLARAVAMVCALIVSGSYWSLALHAVSGMETTFFALMLTVFFAVALALHGAASARRARALAILALLCTLTRPEGALVCGATFVVLVAQAPREERKGLVRALLWFTVLPGALYFAARYRYYGLPLPLPFYVKAQGQAGLAGADDVLSFFVPFVREQPYLGVLALAALWRFRARLLAPGLGALGLVLFFLFPAHIMGYEGRYLFAIFPLLAAAIAAGAALCTEQALALLGRRRAPRSLALLPALVLMVALPLLPFPSWRSYETARWARYGEGLAHAHIPLGHDLARIRQNAGAATIALLDVGATSYYGEWFTIDTYGLNDAHVALTQRKDVSYVFERAPELVVVVSAASGRYQEVFDFEAPIHRAAIARGYRFACDYRFLADYYLHVLVRPGSRLGAELSCATPGA